MAKKMFEEARIAAVAGKIRELTGTDTQYTTATMPEGVEDVSTTGYLAGLMEGGKNKAVAFENYATMITELNSLEDIVFLIGQNIFIVTLNVPDLWISGIADTASDYTYISDEAFANALLTDGSVQVGHYYLSALETQKVDLTEYAKTSEIENGTVVAKNATNAENATYAENATNAENATYATYASEDTSKGTIEERLTALGFKQGSVTFKATPLTTHTNELKRQGNYVIVNFYVSWHNAAYRPNEWDNGLPLKRSDSDAYTDSEGDAYTNIGTIPQEFCPKEDMYVPCYYYGYAGSSAATSASYRPYCEKDLLIRANGEVYVFFRWTSTTTFYVRNLTVNCGYEAAPIE